MEKVIKSKNIMNKETNTKTLKSLNVKRIAIELKLGWSKFKLK